MSDSAEVARISKQISEETSSTPAMSSKDVVAAMRKEAARLFLLSKPKAGYYDVAEAVAAKHGGVGIGRGTYYGLKEEIKVGPKPGVVTRGKFAGQPLSTKPEHVAKRERYAASKKAEKRVKAPKKVKASSKPARKSVHEVLMMLKELKDLLSEQGYTELKWTPAGGWTYSCIETGKL